MPGAHIKADYWLMEFITPYDYYSHGITKVIAHKRTKFQEMFILETGAYGRALVLDGKWQSSEVDEFLYHEPLVQPAMIMKRDPQKVLILGGGEGATAREVLRWKTVNKVVMVDIDEEVVTACKEHLEVMHQGSFYDPRLELKIEDAMQFLENSDNKWDVIISDLSDPIEKGPSFKLFTLETFSLMKKSLERDGILVVQAGPTSPVEMYVHVRLANTLKQLFTNVVSYSSFVPTYGTPWGFLVCGDHLAIPSAKEIDKILEENITGELKLIDGLTLQGMLSTAKHIRKAIEEESVVYTLDSPPDFYGKGIFEEGSE